MGNSDSRIQTSSIDEDHLRVKEVAPLQKYVPLAHKFGDLFRKHQGKITLYTLNVQDPFKQEIKVSTQVFNTLQDAIQDKISHLSIESALADSQFLQRWLFLVGDTAGTNHSLLIRPFEAYNSHNYANILYEIYFADQISKLTSNNLHRIIESYSFPLDSDPVRKNYSQVLVMEGVDANLSQIISFRRSNKLDWSTNEYNKLINDLVTALDVLHQAGISHNNIRPANVYYSIQKNCFLLGSFDNCSKADKTIYANKENQQSQFMVEVSYQSQIDRRKADVYALGVTLLSAFYLSEPLNRTLFLQQNKLLQQRYGILKLIQKMVAPTDLRSTIQQIKSQLPSIQKDSNENNMIDLIKLIGKAKSSDKTGIRWAYQHLGLWNELKYSYEKQSQIQESGLNKAEANHQIAIIQKCRGDNASASNYAKKAASLYKSQGDKHFGDGNLSKAQQSYKKAIQCAKYNEGEHHNDVAESLQSLAQIYFEKNDYKNAKLFSTAAINVTAKSEGKNSLDWCRMCIRQGKLQTEFGAFQESNRLLDECLTVAQTNQKSNQQFKIIIAEALKYKGYNKMKQASHEQDYVRKSTLVEAELSLREALTAYEGLSGNQQNHLVHITKSLGQVEFKRQNYEQSQNYFNKALDLLSHIQNLDEEGRKEKAGLLCLRGSSQSFLDNQLEAIQDFEQALKIYRDIYGSDYNRWSALAIGNLARIYTNAKQIEKARQCLKVSMNILLDIAGQEDPDYQHFARIQSHLEEFL